MERERRHPKVAEGAARGAPEARYLHGVALFDGMTWPLPAKADELDWLLRYGNPTGSDLLVAASICGAYAAMVRDPEKKRRHVIAVLRAASEVE